MLVRPRLHHALKGTEELDVVAVSSPPENEKEFLTLVQVALLVVNRQVWKGEIEPGMTQLKRQYDAARRSGMRMFTLNHYGDTYAVQLTIMDRQTLKLLGMMMGIQARMGQRWEQKLEGLELPNSETWLLSIVPRAR